MLVPYISGVDGLRAISITLVLIYHAFPELIPRGFIGVDIFFVISGFVITRMIASDLANNSFELSQFYLRRLRRLMPTLILVVAVTFLVSILILPPRAFSEFGRSMVATAGFYSNHHFYHKIDYFAAPANYMPLLHTWSLSVEEQFYIIWPFFLLIFGSRFGGNRLLTAALGATVAGFSYSTYLAASNESAAFFMAASRSWQLLIGACLALYLHRARPVHNPLFQIGGAAGLLVILVSAFRTDPDVGFPALALPLCLGTAAIIAACHQPHAYLSQVLSLPVLRYFGGISYPLYVWHWPIFALAASQLERRLTHVEALGFILLAIGLAHLTRRYVEHPIRNGALAGVEGRSPYRSMTPYLLALCASAAVGFSARLDSGWIWRLDESAERVWRQVESTHPFRRKCDGTENALINNSICNFGVKLSDPNKFDLIAIGDSNADHWVPMLSLYAKQHGLSGRQVTRNSCSVLFGQNRPNPSEKSQQRCRAYQEATLGFLKDHNEVRTIFLSLSWKRYNDLSPDNGISISHEYETRPREGDLAHYLDRTLSVLKKQTNAKIIILGPIPWVRKVPVNCVIGDLRSGGDGSTCRVEHKDLSPDTFNVVPIIETVIQNHAGVTAVFPTKTLCDGKSCLIALKNTILLHDVEHLNKDGAELLFDLLAPWPKPG